MEIRTYSGVNFQKVNSINFVDTKTYPNDNSVHLLKEIFTLPENIQDAQNYLVVIHFEGDVEVGRVVTDNNGNKTLLGELYIPAKGVLTLSTQYLKSLLFSDTFLGFRNATSVDSNVKPSFKITIWIVSPDPSV